MYSRAILWTFVAALALIRPGVDRFDRWLATGCWSVPSQWNAVADAAIRTGAVDATIDHEPAPWRHASVQAVGASRVAVVSVSDLHRSRITFLDEQYQPLGGFERIAAEPTLVTDEARGYKPLSHVWPLTLHGDRLHTLIAFAHLVSEEPNTGLFAYVSVGRTDTEVLFVCDLKWGPGPTWGVLSRSDVNGDGVEDFVFLPRGQRDQRPLATFIWDSVGQRYEPQLTDASRGLISWWSTAPGSRVIVPRDALIDNAVRELSLK